MKNSFQFLMNTFIVRELLGVISMVLLFLAFLAHLFDRTASFAQYQDNTYLLIPIFSHISSVFYEGSFPFWMNTLMGGIPLYNSAQFSALYPFYFFNFGLYLDPADAILQIHWVTLFHGFLFTLNTYILSRILGLSRVIAVFAGLGVGLSPNTQSYMTWVNTAPYSWFPLAVGAFILVLNRKYRLLGLILGVASISLLVLASASQALIHLIYFLLGLSVFKLISLIRQKDFFQVLAITKDVLIMAIISILIVSPVLIPTTFDMAEMIRWIGDTPPLIGNAKIPFADFLIGGLEISELVNIIAPVKVPYLIGHAFIGLSILFFSLTALFFRRRSWLITILFVICFIGMFASTGEKLGLAHIFYQLPLLNKIREPGRHLFYFVFCSFLLAGFGIQYLFESIENGRNLLKNRKFQFFIVAFLPLSLLAIYLTSHSKNVNYHLTLVSFFVNLALIVGYAQTKKFKNLFLTGICVSIVLINYLQYPWIAPKIATGDFYSNENIESHAVLKEFSGISNIESYRVLFLDHLNSQWWAMNASYYNIRSFSAYFNPLPYDQFNEMYHHGQKVNNYFESLGARYVLCTDCENKLTSNYKFIRKIQSVRLYESNKAFPHLFISNQIGEPYTDYNHFQTLLNREPLDKRILHFRKSIHNDVSNWLGQPSQMLESEITITSKSPNSIAANISTTDRSILVLNEYFSSNWKSEINGRKSDTIRVNLNQVGILLEKGNNEVVLKYHPTLFIMLIYLSSLTLLLCTSYLLFLLFKDLKKKR